MTLREITRARRPQQGRPQLRLLLQEAQDELAAALRCRGGRLAPGAIDVDQGETLWPTEASATAAAPPLAGELQSLQGVEGLAS